MTDSGEKNIYFLYSLKLSPSLPIGTLNIIEGQNRRGAWQILSPFQRALVEAVLKRYQAVLQEDTITNDEAVVDQCLWIDWKTGIISMSKREEYSRFICDSTEHRAIAIKNLRAKGFTILP